MYVGFDARELVFDCPLSWAADFWQLRLISTLKSKKVSWALNAEIYQIINEVYLMAKQPIKQDRTYAKSSAVDIQWVNITLTDEDVLSVTTWLDDEPNLLVEVVKLVDAGYAFGCKPSNDGNGFMATLIGKNPGDDKSTYGLSAYATNAYDACGCLLYKFISRLEGIFPTSSIEGKRRFR